MLASSSQVVAEVFASVIETTAFMFGEPADKGELSLAGSPMLQATMAFHGPMSGTLIMAVPHSACLEIAANMLGMDAADEFVAQRATDSLKEILNITCGNVLTGLAGDKPIFDLSIPQVADLDEAGLAALLEDPRTQAFLADECPMLLRLTVDGE